MRDTYCKCGGSEHESCDPRWPANLSDDMLLRVYETSYRHPVTGCFNEVLTEEMRRRGLSSRHWLPVDDDD